jgi:two-component system response regulator AtoC
VKSQSKARESATPGRVSPSVLLVEDEEVFARAVCTRLGRAGFSCRMAHTLAQAREQIAHRRPDLILLDMRLPDGSGLDFLTRLRTHETQQNIPVVVLTAYGEVDDAVAAMKLNAVDYLKKPVDLDELVLILEKILETASLTQRLSYSRKRDSRATEGVRLLGESSPMVELRAQIERVASLAASVTETPPTVLILGETGSGKDVTGRLLHLQSARSERPYVHVDCAALPKELIEAELFGHEKGAFTSAHAARVGLIEAAEDGTVFLDEIAELPLDLQSKLLAVIERRRMRRVGASEERPVAAWFLAASNRPMAEMVKQGAFRADLYYRLRVLSLSIPPLRERGADIVLLGREFAAATAKRYGIGLAEITPDAEEALRAYSWPGNVRELKHVMERAVLQSAGSRIGASQLMLEGSLAASATDGGPSMEGMTLEAAEHRLIRHALERTQGNVSEAARRLGIGRTALRYRMKKHGLR